MIVEIKQRVAAVEEHLGNNPQQPLPHNNSNITRSNNNITWYCRHAAACHTEEQREQLFREYMSLNYQPPPDLECALDQFPSVATYKDFPSQVKRMEIKKFEDNIKRMYKLPIDKSNTNDSAGSSVGAQSAILDYFVTLLAKTRNTLLDFQITSSPGSPGSPGYLTSHGECFPANVLVSKSMSSFSLVDDVHE
ncbi:hypothetical protein BDC45DRAFT_611368 [Circinella umbellata]|nr:hypothetical protein BDC45DRAFT_611368 [Circinella umbellata]